MGSFKRDVLTERERREGSRLARRDGMEAAFGAHKGKWKCGLLGPMRRWTVRLRCLIGRLPRREVDESPWK
ncbi:hypothetical protein HMPREF1985_01138 [Mitsuokella sp. oral taxon 131 str. W9106]|nr:hypothetical protein HMPREF1985_01138 [Mitsuokella sp. oral taxon 131 str. W9106]